MGDMTTQGLHSREREGVEIVLHLVGYVHTYAYVCTYMSNRVKKSAELASAGYHAAAAACSTTRNAKPRFLCFPGIDVKRFAHCVRGYKDTQWSW
jgi:hypothetical protein